MNTAPTPSEMEQFKQQIVAVTQMIKNFGDYVQAVMREMQQFKADIVNVLPERKAGRPPKQQQLEENKNG